VTQVLDPLLELDGIPKDVLKAAAEFGTHVHMACDLYDRGVLDEPALDPRLAPYLSAWKLFLHETGSKVVHSEIRVASAKLKYAGTLDKIVQLGRVINRREPRVLLDIKSGLVPRTVGPQTAAYLNAYSPTPMPRYCLQLRGDASYRLEKLDDPSDFSIFVSALNLHRWRTK
jgi:hypothetical protein